MQKHLTWLIVGIFAAMAIIGCGGGSSNKSSSITMPGVQLTIGANTLMSSVDPSGLDENATIEVFDFATGQRLTTGKIGADGKGTVRVTAGLTVAIIISGTRDGKSYRMSTIIPSVPTGDTEYVATPETTLAAEALAQRFYRTNTSVDYDTFNSLVQEARTCLTALAPEQRDVAVGGGLLNANAGFGTTASLTSSAAPVQGAVPQTIDNNLVKAKNSIRQVKEIGLPLKAIASDERAGIEQVYESFNNGFGDFDLSGVIAKYSALSDRLNVLLLPAINGDWEYINAPGGIPNSTQRTHIFDLTMGKGYRVIEQTGMSLTGSSWYQIYPDASLDVANRITVKLTTEEGTITVIATESSSGWTLTQTSTGDTAQLYKVVIPNVELGTNPVLNGSISLKDSELTTPVNFTGSARAIGVDVNHYTSITYTGTLTSEEVKASGTFAAQFAPPSIIGPTGNNTYDFPISVSMSNASISVTATGTTVTLSGDFSALATVVTEYGSPRSKPTEFHITGRLSVQSGACSFALTGGADAMFTYKPYNDQQIRIPTLLKYRDAKVAISDGTNEIGLSGGVTMEGTSITVGGRPEAVPTSITILGEYHDTASKQSINGSVVATWTNPAASTTIDTAQGTLTLKGEVKRDNYTPYALDMVFTLNGQQQVACAINKIAFGITTITGSINGAWDSTGNITNGSLTLTNQGNVQLAVTYTGGDISGNITSGGEVVATIAEDSLGLVSINFIDGSVEKIPA